MPIRSLLQHFEQLPDPRREHLRLHPLHTILTIALCAMLCEVEDFEGMQEFVEDKFHWLSQRGDLSNGVPSHDTFGRVFAKLQPKLFSECLCSWIQDIREVGTQEVLAIDGKTLRHSFDTAKERYAIHVVSAFAT